MGVVWGGEETEEEGLWYLWRYGDQIGCPAPNNIRLIIPVALPPGGKLTVGGGTASRELGRYMLHYWCAFFWIHDVWEGSVSEV